MIHKSQKTRGLMFSYLAFTFVVLMFNSLRADDWSDLQFKNQIESSLIQQSRQLIETVVPKTHYYISLSVSLNKPVEVVVETENKNSLIVPVLNESELADIDKKTDRVYLEKINGLWISPKNEKAASPKPKIKPREIEKITAQISFDQSIDLERVKPIQAMLEGLFKSYTSKVNLKVDKIKIFVEPPKEPVPPPPKMETNDWIKMFKDTAAIVLVGLLGFFGYLFANLKRVAVEREKVSVMKAASEAKSSSGDSAAATSPTVDKTDHHEEDHHKNGESQAASDADIQSMQKDLEATFQKIDSLVANNPADFGFLIKTWLAEESLVAGVAVSLLSTSIPVEKIKKITQTLTADQKTIWKKRLLPSISTADRISGLSYMNRSIADYFLNDFQSIDTEALEAIATLSPRDASELIKKNSNLAGVLFSNMSSLQISRIFTLISQEDLSGILKNSVNAKSAGGGVNWDEIKKAIADVRNQNKTAVNPFVDRAFELIKQVSTVKEISIFEAVASTGQDEALSRLSIAHFPGELVFDLPAPFLNSIFMQMSIQKRAEVLVSQAVEKRNKLLACFGTSGKTREMIDMEIQTITSDEKKVKFIEKSSEVIWSEFLKVLRVTYRNQDFEPEDIEVLRKKWVADLLAKNKVGDLRAAA